MGNDTTVLYYDRGDSTSLWNRNDAATQLTTDSIGAMGTTSSFKLSNNDGNLNGGWLHALGGLYKPARISYYLRISETVKYINSVRRRRAKTCVNNNNNSEKTCIYVCVCVSNTSISCVI